MLQNLNEGDPPPQISIIMPLYNAAATVRRAIDSALAQNGWEIELVIVDDCSTDDSVALVRQAYGDDRRIRLISAETNQGPAHARNRAIEEARGEWIALLDADDAWTPDRLDHLMAFAAEADMIADRLVAYDAVAMETTGPFFRTPSPTGAVDFAGLVGLRGDFDAGYLKPIMRRSFLRENELRYRTELRHGEDFMLYATAMCLNARFVLVANAGYIYTTPIGRKSRARSPHSRTIFDDSALREAIVALGRTHASRLSRRDQKALRRRLWQFEIKKDYFDFLARLRRRDVGGALSVAARRPAVVTLAARNVLSRL